MLRFSRPAIIVAAYALIASIWILLTGALLFYFSGSPEEIHAWEMAKGIFFVFATAGFLYFMIQRNLMRVEQASQRLSAVIESMMEAVFIFDKDLNCVQVNRAAKILTQVSDRSELLRPAQELIDRFELKHADLTIRPAEGFELLKEYFRSKSKGADLKNYPPQIKDEDLHLTLPSLVRLDVSLSASVVSSARKHWVIRSLPDIDQYVVVLKDITERKSAERRTRIAAQVSALLAESLDLGVILKNLVHYLAPTLADWCQIVTTTPHHVFTHVDLPTAGGLQERIRQLSFVPDARQRGISRVLATGLSEFAGRVDLQWVGGAPNTPGLEGSLRFSELVRIFREAGVLSYLCVPIMIRDQTVGALFLATFQSSHRALEIRDLELAREIALRVATAMDHVQLYSEARRALDLRDEFLASVSHDLKNPLSAISMNISMAEKNFPRDLDHLKSPEVMRRLSFFPRQLDLMRQSVHQMGAIIRDLLDLSKMEADRFVPEQRMIGIGQLLSEAVGLMEPLAEEKRVSLLLGDVDEQIDSVFCSRERLLRVFSNLIGNAINFTGPEGIIVLEARRWDQGVLFSVRDSGVGIPQDQLSHIFERFWQGTQSAATQKLGTGLGLTISKRIIQAHGGEIWAESSPGTGTTVFFTLPQAYLRSEKGQLSA